MIPQRSLRVAELLKRELSNIILQDLQNPKLGFVSITKVIVAKDLKHANVWVSVMGDDTVKQTSLDALTHAQNHIKELLARRVKLRYLPTLLFRLDTSIEYNAHIGDIINRLKKEEGWDK